MPISLFSPYQIGSLKLRNRLVRSATYDGLADSSGAVTEDTINLYCKLAQGGIGLIITGYAFVSPEARAAPRQYGIHSNDMIPGLSRLVKVAHDSGTPIAIQLAHAGINLSFLRNKELTALAVSKIPQVKQKHHEMTDEEIEAIILSFAQAAVRAREAGFDAIQLHGAHGYLLSQFLSPLFNHRSDRWGGSAENRRRFHLEVIKSIKKATGTDFPLMIKLGLQDDREGGLNLSEGIEAARAMVAQGITAIEVSTGVSTPTGVLRQEIPERAYFRESAAALKRAVGVSVTLVGGIRSPELAQDILDKGEADLIALCRPFIREPDLARRWQKGDKRPAECISCNQCLSIALETSLRCGELIQ